MTTNGDRQELLRRRNSTLLGRDSREREGKQRGSHGLPIGELRVLIMALNARNQSAESKQMAGSFQFGRKTMLASGDVIFLFFSVNSNP